MKITTLALCIAWASLSAAAQAAWPERPVRLVVPYTPGGSVDTLARLVADEMGRNLSHPIIVENKPGASGIVASQHVARATPDGHTLLFHASSQVSLPQVDANAKYDALKDFSHIAFIGEVPLVVAVPANSPYKTLRDLQQGRAPIRACPGAPRASPRPATWPRNCSTATWTSRWRSWPIAARRSS